ncbi:probable terpene synthase 9 [Telopea speciosissima]|uniref:probable terpene synthase 9 n=1 Tax=Telopea speciosissima TaxID=54955 RepID=UPI001CC68FDE|nr:probable terpene synthase 9 [Telopea speciosissima]
MGASWKQSRGSLAAHLGMTGEAVLEEAMDFTWNFINVYGKEHTKKSSSILVELAKLDFNIVQSVHQRDLQELSRWWRDLASEEELCFARDRLVENFMWAIGIIYELGFSKCRIRLTKLISILMVIDDIYDVYGSLDELELFIKAVDSESIAATSGLGPNWFVDKSSLVSDFISGFSWSLLQEEIFWTQNSRVQWMKEGEEEVEGEAIRYFTDIVTTQGSPRDDDLLQHIPQLVTEDDNSLLLATLLLEEVKKAVFDLSADSALGADGLSGYFTACWEIVGNNVWEAVKEFLQVAFYPGVIP